MPRSTDNTGTPPPDREITRRHGVKCPGESPAGRRIPNFFMRA
jgi:hypothetical protein